MKPPRKQAKPGAKLAYFNRELSWLAFNRRVLDLALGDKLPVLERMRFLSIVSSNLDEFFEIRVAGLMQQVDSNLVQPGIDGLGPKEQLRRIHSIATSIIADQYECWHNKIVPTLKDEGVHFKTRAELSAAELRWVRTHFEDNVYPVLTPLGIDPAHPFPHLINKSLNILVWLKDPEGRGDGAKMAIVPVPRILPRVVQIELKSRKKSCYIFLSDIIKIFIGKLFPGYTVRGAWAFRITRNSDLYIDEEEAQNLLQKIEEELHKMRKGAAVRLEIEAGVNDDSLNALLKAINLSQEHVFAINGPINLLRLFSVFDLIDKPHLKFPPFAPYTPPALSRTGTIFQTIKQEDILLHHPYHSFNPVVDFINEAASDPKVVALKQTLYRTSGDSPIIEALKTASANGKQVTALIEIKARFDEANNIEWARQLEDVGVHVVYGMVGLKTHCKCCLVIRRENDGMQRYAHLGTGNYNPKTARIYTDLSLLTANDAITDEVAALFNTLTGFSRHPEFKKLLVAPFNYHSHIQQLILREAANAKAGKPAKIMAKVNSLIDRETINNLYAASQAGVQIDLIVRGICGLVPGVRGLSQNIRVRSIVGRFLEHSRAFYFENAPKQPVILAGSADWMQRNFFRRIECVFPIESPKWRKFIIEEFFPLQLRDNQFATQLRANGSYSPVNVPTSGEAFSCQDYWLTEATRMRKMPDIEKSPSNIPPAPATPEDGEAGVEQGLDKESAE